MVAVNCSNRMRQGLRSPFSSSSLGPTCSRRWAASVLLRPWEISEFSWETTSPESSLYQSTRTSFDQGLQIMITQRPQVKEAVCLKNA